MPVFAGTHAEPLYTHTFLTTFIKSSSCGFRREHYRSSSTFYGYKRGVHQGFGSPQTQHQSVEHHLQLMKNPTAYATHTEIVAANQSILVQHPRATDIVTGQPYPLPPSANTCGVLYSNEHYSTCGTQHPLTTNKLFARTSVQRAPTAIHTLFPLSTALSLEQCTSSCHTFPP